LHRNILLRVFASRFDQTAGTLVVLAAASDIKTTRGSQMSQQDVPIKIDTSNLQTPTPTTGAALYTLGSIGADYDLWLENPGPTEDTFIANDAQAIDVKPGSHFYTAKKQLNPGHV
jgi:hypothetical protein